MKPDLTHAIRTRPDTYYTGRTSDNDQVLLGWLGDSIVVLRFNDTGKLLDVIEYPLNLAERRSLGPKVEAFVLDEVAGIKRRLGFRDDMIRVKPFFLDRLHAGIRPFPEDLAEYLAEPASYPEEDAEVFREDVKRWLEAGNCVFVWENEYDLDDEGFTI